MPGSSPGRTCRAWVSRLATRAPPSSTSCRRRPKLRAAEQESPPSMSIAHARDGALALLLVFASAGPVAAAVFHATNGRDLPDADLTDADCDAGYAVDNACTLRAAIQNANLTPEEDTIGLSGITYSLSLKGPNEDDSAAGDLDVTTPIIITSDDDDADPPTTGNFATTVIDANKLADRIFDVKPGG